MAHTRENVVPGATQEASGPSAQDICDSYLYFLGRLLVLRQEQLDFQHEGFKWNELIHRKVGGVAWANPNLDVACSEAWIAVDETSCTIIDVPPIVGRYYTVQAINPWGETIANLNERKVPGHPSGSFAFCLQGAQVALPAGTQRIDLSGHKARILVRIELGSDPQEAVALQHRITMRATGVPKISSTVDVPSFTNDRMPGAEAFDRALAVLGAEPDINPGSAALQAKVRTIAAGIHDVAERGRVDRIVRRQAWRQLRAAVMNMGVVGNGWVHPRVAGNYGSDWLGRTVANLTGIWANSKEEVVSFGAGTAKPINGSDTYTMTFARQDLPDTHAKYFWSVICVDAINFRVIPNAENLFVLDRHAPLQHSADGSLTLYFAPRLPPGAPAGNWLPTPTGQNYLLTWRSYGPDRATASGTWFPPELQRR